MKALGKNEQDFHVLQGPAVSLQKHLKAMAERYKVVIHAANINAAGDAVIIVERRQRDA